MSDLEEPKWRHRIDEFGDCHTWDPAGRYMGIMIEVEEDPPPTEKKEE
jgi:hypothetical protein